MQYKSVAINNNYGKENNTYRKNDHAHRHGDRKSIAD